MAVDVTCLYSTVRNVSGATRFFGFLPPHGMTLDDNEEVTIFGNILEAVNRGDRYGKRWMEALESAIGNNATNTAILEILNTPAAIMYDATDEVPYMLISDNATLSVTAPCWETSLS